MKVELYCLRKIDTCRILSVGEIESIYFQYVTHIAPSDEGFYTGISKISGDYFYTSHEHVIEQKFQQAIALGKNVFIDKIIKYYR